MRHLFLVILLICGFSLTPRPAAANCYVLSQVDRMHQTQMGLLRDAQSPFFRDDIRRLRDIATGLSTPEILRAVDGGNWTGHGADFRRFLANTLGLLQMASVDDPRSVRAHFSAPVRANLQRVGVHLNGLRCTPAQVAEARRAQLRAAADSPLPPPVPSALAGAALLLLAIWLVRRLFRRRILIQRKRAKRHRLRYPTRFWWNNQMGPGTLRDINRAGTRLVHESGAPLPPGAVIDLDLHQHWTSGTIVWSDSQNSGIRFQDQLTLDTVNRLRNGETVQKPGTTTQNGAPKDAVS